MNPLRTTRGWLGPLGRYRPSLFRRDMLEGWEGEAVAMPGWLRKLRQEWCSPEEQFLANLPLGGQVVYDLGAYRGDYSLYFSRRVGPMGVVVSCEPQPANFAYLTRRLERLQVTNVRALPLAIGQRARVATLFALPGMATTASLAQEARTICRRAVGTAQVETLDALIATLNLPAPEFIKIDVEGHELEVLRGARETLAASGAALLIEVHGVGRQAKCERVREITGLLRGLRYEVQHVESGRDAGRNGDGIAGGHLYAQRGS
ncbi:MAG: FkbM family methyltransferase [Terriglobales bacterium]